MNLYPLRHISAFTTILGTLIMTPATALSAIQATVIQLNQVSCQILESENGIDHGYKSTRKADCDAINARTAQKRVAGVKPLELQAGKYIFRVTNKNVPYSLGFWMRGAGLVGRASLPSVSGGGLTTGKTLDYEIELKPGKYFYSCPLNTTPDYHLTVTE